MSFNKKFFIITIMYYFILKHDLNIFKYVQ